MVAFRGGEDVSMFDNEEEEIAMARVSGVISMDKCWVLVETQCKNTPVVLPRCPPRRPPRIVYNYSFPIYST